MTLRAAFPRSLILAIAVVACGPPSSSRELQRALVAEYGKGTRASIWGPHTAGPMIVLDSPAFDTVPNSRVNARAQEVARFAMGRYARADSLDSLRVWFVKFVPGTRGSFCFGRGATFVPNRHGDPRDTLHLVSDRRYNPACLIWPPEVPVWRPPLSEAPHAFEEIEEQMLNLSYWRDSFFVTAEGAVEARLAASFEMGRWAPGTYPYDFRINAAGRFMADSVTLHFLSDAATMEGGAGERTFRHSITTGLRESILLGITRMGIMHNLARLTAGQPPDRSGGGMRDWVQVENVRYDSTAAARFPNRIALTFDILVGGRRTAEATLWVDEDMRPRRREQTVTFPGGSMRVTEEYGVRGAPTDTTGVD